MLASLFGQLHCGALVGSGALVESGALVGSGALVVFGSSGIGTGSVLSFNQLKASSKLASFKAFPVLSRHLA